MKNQFYNTALAKKQRGAVHIALYEASETFGFPAILTAEDIDQEGADYWADRLRGLGYTVEILDGIGTGDTPDLLVSK